MENLQKRTWAEVSLKNIAYNYKSIKAALPEGCEILGIVKADAYGHGAVPVARCLEKLGAPALAVACIDEAEELRGAGVTLPILILGVTPAECTGRLAELDLTQAVCDIEAARDMSAILTQKRHKLKVHIKLDSGMGRLGFAAGRPKAESELLEILSLPGLEVEGIFTHLAVSDEPGEGFTQEQFRRFLQTVKTLEKTAGRRFKLRHCANSGAVVNYKELSLDMVRPGISMYGMYPGSETGGIDLKPAMEVKTRVMSITEHFPGDTISYGRTYTVTQPMRVAVLPIGYADGLHRVLSNNMDVLIHGKRTKQLGRICMDMCMVDITHIPGCKIGDIVTIFGHDGNEFIPVEEHAKNAGTISYEMVCAMSRRVPRVYIDKLDV